MKEPEVIDENWRKVEKVWQRLKWAVVFVVVATLITVVVRIARGEDGRLVVPVVPGTQTTITITQQPLPGSATPAPVSSPTPAATPTPTPVATPTPPPQPAVAPVPAVSLGASFVLAFDEEFNEGASFDPVWISDKPNIRPLAKYPYSPRWYDQKPGNGAASYFFSSWDPDYSGSSGGGGVDAPLPYQPFTVDAKTAGFPAGPAAAGPLGDGYLYIYGVHMDYHTSSGDKYGDDGGILSTLDYTGHGFKAALAYWEAKIWNAPITTGSPAFASGVWPGFWLLSANLDDSGEIDIMEAYSNAYTSYHTNVHATNQGTTVQAGVDLSAGWHIYSCLIDKVNITFYLDGKQVSQFPSTAADWGPLFAMVQLAFTGGWPDQQNWGIDPAPGNTTSTVPYPNTTNMKVAYVRCWALPGNF